MILITIFLQKFAENLTFNVIFYLINRYICDMLPPLKSQILKWRLLAQWLY